MPLKPVQISKFIHRGETRIKIEFERNDLFISKVKSIQDRKWSQTKRCWHLPYAKTSFEALENVFGKEQLVFPEKENSLQPNVSNEKILGEKAVDDFKVRIEEEHDFRVKVFVPWQKKEWIEKIKSLPDRAWNKEAKYWSVPKDENTLRQLKGLFGEQLIIANKIQEWRDKNVKENKEKDLMNLLQQGNSEKLEQARKEYRLIKKDGKEVKAITGEKVIVEKKDEQWLKVFIPFDKKGWIAVVRNIPLRKWVVEDKYW